MQLVKTHTQSSHWYTIEGVPMHETMGKNGNIRAVNVKDARKLNLLPSVSSILNVVADWGLESWKQEQVALSALTYPNPSNLSAHDLAPLIVADAANQGRLAAEAGIAEHDAIAGFVQTGKFETLTTIRAPFSTWYEENISNFVACEKVLVHPMGYAGRVDLIAYYQGGITVIDFKTKETKGKPIPFYPKWGCQLAAYAKAYRFTDPSKDTPHIISVVISRDEPGRIEVKAWEDIDALWKAFLQCFEIWKGPLGKNYDPMASTP